MLSSTRLSNTPLSMQTPLKWLLPGMLAGILLLGGCGQLARFGLGNTPIQSVVSNPSAHTTVTVRGQVVNTLGILGQGFYELQDETGSLWVITGGQGMPVVNSTVTVRGTAAEGITISGRNFGVTLTEQERF
ncbi:MAG: hypothetical protein ACFCU9_00895 [Cyanophyceae cyanobacterium]